MVVENGGEKRETRNEGRFRRSIRRRSVNTSVQLKFVAGWDRSIFKAEFLRRQAGLINLTWNELGNWVDRCINRTDLFGFQDRHPRHTRFRPRKAKRECKSPRNSWSRKTVTFDPSVRAFPSVKSPANRRSFWRCYLFIFSSFSYSSLTFVPFEIREFCLSKVSLHTQRILVWVWFRLGLNEHFFLAIQMVN